RIITHAGTTFGSLPINQKNRQYNIIGTGSPDSMPIGRFRDLKTQKTSGKNPGYFEGFVASYLNIRHDSMTITGELNHEYSRNSGCKEKCRGPQHRSRPIRP
ncbi:MAG: hypothetical protein Q8R64_14080, partial [Sulfurimicrobium sp.]|nr:hypothetical protein [Sulfurimicrobium sp.]